MFLFVMENGTKNYCGDKYVQMSLIRSIRLIDIRRFIHVHLFICV